MTGSIENPHDRIIGPDEYIPDIDTIFHRIVARAFPEGTRFVPTMIRQQGEDGISVYWDKYATPEDCLRYGNPEDDIIALSVGSVRALRFDEENLVPLEVRHDPTYAAPAHSLIVKLGRTKAHKAVVRNKLFGLVHLEIKNSSFNYSDAVV